MRNSAVTLKTAIPQYFRTVEQRYPKQAAAFKQQLETKLLPIAEDRDRDRIKASTNPEASELGRRKEGTAIDHRADRDLDSFEQATAGMMDKRLKHGSAELLAGAAPIARPSDPSERLAYELRLQEIRHEARPVSKEERGLILMQTNDAMVIDALETAPPILTRAQKGAIPQVTPFVDPAVVNAARLARARDAAPDKAAELEMFAFLAETYRMAIGLVRSAIREDSPAPTGESFIDPRTGTALTAPAPEAGTPEQ